MTSVIERIGLIIFMIGIIFSIISIFFYGIKYSPLVGKPLSFKEFVRTRKLFVISSLIFSLGGTIIITTSGLQNGSVTWIEIIIMNALCLVGFPLVMFFLVGWIFGRLVVKGASK